MIDPKPPGLNLKEMQELLIRMVKTLKVDAENKPEGPKEEEGKQDPGVNL